MTAGPNVSTGPESGHVWIVATGSGYYPESAWSSLDLAVERARELGLPEKDDASRNIQLWKIDTPGSEVDGDGWSWPTDRSWKKADNGI